MILDLPAVLAIGIGLATGVLVVVQETQAARERDRQKARYQTYRQAAWLLVSRSDAQGAPLVRVPDHAEVREVEDGAFVEAVVWVPRGAVEDK